jgi:hypothetical protein
MVSHRLWMTRQLCAGKLTVGVRPEAVACTPTDGAEADIQGHQNIRHTVSPEGRLPEWATCSCAAAQNGVASIGGYNAARHSTRRLREYHESRAAPIFPVGGTGGN